MEKKTEMTEWRSCKNIQCQNQEQAHPQNTQQDSHLKVNDSITNPFSPNPALHELYDFCVHKQSSVMEKKMDFRLRGEHSAFAWKKEET